jgi:GTP cyclohydrolase IA
MAVDETRVEAATRELLLAIGEDPDREGLLETPQRVARFWTEFIDHQEHNHEKTFEAVTVDQLVVVRGIDVWSLCEHHMLPFHSEVIIGYIPKVRVLGLSKFARIARKHAHSLQLQERMIESIADDINRLTKTEDVAVLARAQHLCMQMRGVKAPADMVTSIMRGQFSTSFDKRMEFLSLAGEIGGRPA